MLRQIVFFSEYLRFQKQIRQLTGIFQVSNAWTKLWKNMVEEKAVVKKQNSKRGFEKKEHACSVE